MKVAFSFLIVGETAPTMPLGATALFVHSSPVKVTYKIPVYYVFQLQMNCKGSYFGILQFGHYSQVPNKRGALIIRGLEKLPKFNKRGGQNKRGDRNSRNGLKLL